MKKNFYAIDMGSPSKNGGFFCWKYSLANHELTSFKGTRGWLKCIKEIAKDVKNSEVHLTIEAPLWGNKLKNGNQHWCIRFQLSKNKKFTEHPWYTLAGATTGFMAQEFLLELNDCISKNKKAPKKKITLRESYISGVKANVNIEKPDSFIETKKGKHANDAFESLLLTLDANSIEKKDYIFDSIGKNETEKWFIQTPNEIIFLNSDKYLSFPLGMLKKQKYFDFKCDEILFMKRTLFK